MGWFGAFRRSELVALTVADVKKEREGLAVAVRRSKSDQEGRGAEKGSSSWTWPNGGTRGTRLQALEAAPMSRQTAIRPRVELREDRIVKLPAKVPVGPAEIIALVEVPATRGAQATARFGGRARIPGDAQRPPGEAPATLRV